MKIPFLVPFLLLPLIVLMALQNPLSAETTEAEDENRIQVRDVEVTVTLQEAVEPNRERGKTAAQSAQGLAQSIEGELRRARNRMLFFPPPHPFELTDTEGKRMAWVNLHNAIYSGSIGQFLQKRVVIHGEIVTPEDESARNSVIEAKKLRLR